MTLPISHKNLSGGRKLYTLAIPNLGLFEALDIPATSLTDQEWRLITLARQSYAKIWGGANVYRKIENDPFDGRPPHNAQYPTTHQIAKYVSPSGREKFFTNRKVTLNPGSPLFDDIVFWQVSQTPLWDFIKKKLKAPPEFQIAAISRTGTYPYSVRDKSELDHDITAISWTLMQVATTQADNHTYFSCQLCAEFQDRVLTISTPDHSLTKLNFSKTPDVLGLAPSQPVKLDRTNPYVRDHIFNFPGYWTNNSDLFTLLSNLAADSRFSLPDFSGIVSRLPITAPAGITDLIKLLTRPRYCKYLIPLINHPGQINPRLTGDQLRQGILDYVGDGPFSSTLIPKNWRQSALNLLQSAFAKYSSGK